MAKRKESDLALRALAAIQALELADAATEFRNVWLQGEVLPDWPAAVRWLQHHRPPQPEVGKHTKLKQFYVLDEDGIPRDLMYFEATSVFGELTRFCNRAEELYGWNALETQQLVLLGRVPQLKAVRVKTTYKVLLGAHLTPGRSPWAAEVVLTCRPQATKEEVADCYQAARTKMLEGALGERLGPRNRAITEQRTQDLAVLGSRVWSGEFPSLHAVFETHLENYPHDIRLDMKTFKRDLRWAFKRVTGYGLSLPPTRASVAEADISKKNQK